MTDRRPCRTRASSAKKRIGLDGRQRHPLGQALAGFDLHDEEFRVALVRVLVRSTGDSSEADQFLAFTGVIDEHRIARGHAADVLQRDWIADSVPDSAALTLELIERV